MYLKGNVNSSWKSLDMTIYVPKDNLASKEILGNISYFEKEKQPPRPAIPSNSLQSHFWKFDHKYWSLIHPQTIKRKV
jgi:hypothetical protein